MQPFYWDNNFETGLDEVDNQHHHLVDLINQFGHLISENRVRPRDIELLFHELAHYADYHFKQEQELMQELALDSRHTTPHIEAHDSFLKQVTNTYNLITDDNPKSVNSLFEYLTHWLTYHILGSDQNMARQIRAIKEGISPEQAFDLCEKEVNSTTEPLLIAMNGLFQQLSEQNEQLFMLNQSLEEKVAKRTQELYDANQNLKKLSLTDPLTGLPNRRHAMLTLSALWEESLANQTALSCMMLDADKFKHINDSYGHDIGDLVLVKLATTLHDALRSDDSICRLGGDEFLILCPNTDSDGALMIANNLLKMVSQLSIPTGGEPWQGSISIGISSRYPKMSNFDQLIKEADRALYAAKNEGRNCARRAIDIEDQQPF